MAAHSFLFIYLYIYYIYSVLPGCMSTSQKRETNLITDGRETPCGC
ncbi:hypothetical protein LEMLEM_LOCUS4176 [Lemmus lemmus]